MGTTFVLRPFAVGQEVMVLN